MRRHMIRVHYNKHTGLWTIKHKGRCIPASKVDIRCGCRTEIKDTTRNPRAFIVAYGFLLDYGDGNFVVSGNMEYIDKKARVV